MFRLILCMAVAAVGATAAGADPVKPATRAAWSASTAFDRLKQLAGNWRLEKPTSAADRDKTVICYRVTAGGSAVVETIFPGQPIEMITVYHRNDRDLMLTHYCCCGNQPRMKARLRTSHDELIFDFAGGTNLDPAKDTHMHRCRLWFVDADHLHSEAQLYVHGKLAETHSFDLVRKK